MDGHKSPKPTGDPKISWEPPANLGNFQLWAECPTLDGVPSASQDSSANWGHSVWAEDTLMPPSALRM